MNEYTIKDNKIVFQCGCEFSVSDKKTNFVADLKKPKHNINFFCKATYQILCDGLTQGIFQLQSALGTQWTKKVQPSTIYHVSALSAILRPGCMNTRFPDGLSTTIHYERRKNNKEETPPYHPIVDKILANTFNLCIYQENMLNLSKEVAGFSLQEADILRKGIGKKEPATIAKCKVMFLEKGKEAGILSEGQLNEIWGWIESSQRYAFCAAHAMAYGITGYNCAYIKGHFPIQFYKARLTNEKNREEYAGLINEAKLFDITVNPPDIRDFRHNFYNRKRNIYFGLSSIKGIVKKDIDSLAAIFTEKGWLSNDLGSSTKGNRINWITFLRDALDNISSRTVEGLIHSGALDCFEMDRARLAYEYEKYNLLTPVEKRQYSRESSLVDLIQTCIKYYEEKFNKAFFAYNDKVLKREMSTRKRKKEPKPLVPPKADERLAKLHEVLDSLDHPLYNIQDTLDSIIYHEEDLLGTALTRHASDAIINCVQTHTCMDLAEGCKEYAVLRVKIDQANRWTCKNGSSAGKSMCFMKVSDNTCRLDNVVCFATQYEEFQHLLTKDNLVFISGTLGKENSFIVNKVYPIS